MCAGIGKTNHISLVAVPGETGTGSGDSREGDAHAALVFDGDAAVAWCQYGGALDLIAKAGGGVVEGYPQDTQGKKISASFLYNTTRSLYERTGFSYDRPKGKNHCVMRRTVSPARKPRRAGVE